jgi:hypothetical protein
MQIESLPGRKAGSCCTSDFKCQPSNDKDNCTAAGGDWAAQSDACDTNMFCSGACCIGGGTADATCRVTKKDECVQSSGKWVVDGDCNDPTFCPKVNHLTLHVNEGCCCPTAVRSSHRAACAALLCAESCVHLYILHPSLLFRSAQAPCLMSARLGFAWHNHSAFCSRNQRVPVRSF